MFLFVLFLVQNFAQHSDQTLFEDLAPGSFLNLEGITEHSQSLTLGTGWGGAGWGKGSGGEGRGEQRGGGRVGGSSAHLPLIALHFFVLYGD